MPDVMSAHVWNLGLSWSGVNRGLQSFLPTFCALSVPIDLSIREAAFAAQYVAKHGNGTQAAIAAGYAPSAAHVAASRLIRRGKVKRQIDRLTRKHEITADRVLTRLDNLSAKAEESGNYPAAVRAEELIGKSLGMWVDRSVSVSLDLTGQHIEAIRALASRRIQKNTTPGDSARVIDGGAATVTGNGNTVYPYNMHYGKLGKGGKSVIDQGDSLNVDANGALSDAPNVDGHNI